MEHHPTRRYTGCPRHPDTLPDLSSKGKSCVPFNSHCGHRGLFTPVNDTFVWLYEKSSVWNELHTQIKPVLTPLEQLRALKWACWAERLGDSAVEGIFYDNAARLFGLSST